MKKELKKRSPYLFDEGHTYLTTFEESALIYLLRHSNIVRFQKDGFLYNLYFDNQIIPNIRLCERYLVLLFLEVYNCEVKND